MDYSYFEVGGHGQPYQEEGEGPCFPRSKDPSYGQGRPPRLEGSCQRECYRHNVGTISTSSNAQLHASFGGQGTIPWGIQLGTSKC